MSSGPPFRMRVVDVFTFPGRGTVVTGRIESGSIGAFTEIDIEGQDGVGKAVVTDVMIPDKRVKHAEAGDVVSLLLRGVAGAEKQDVRAGDLLLRGSGPGKADQSP